MATELGKPGGNDGIRMLDDFLCDAVCAENYRTAPTGGRGVNADMDVLSEFAVCSSQPPLTAERTRELRALTNSQLLVLVRLYGSELAAEELRFIHDIAITRLIRPDASVSEGADKVSREAMQATLNRIAS